MADDSVLQVGDLIVTPTVTQVQLAQAYIRMEEEGTLATVFYQKLPTLAEFMAEFLTAGRRVTLGCFRQQELCGLGWVFQPVTMDKYVKCETGMVFFRRQSNPRDNLSFGKMMLQVFFERYPVDVIFGVTPDPNKLALRYARKLGFSLHGPIPDYCSFGGELVDGWISHMSKEGWAAQNR